MPYVQVCNAIAKYFYYFNIMPKKNKKVNLKLIFELHVQLVFAETLIRIIGNIKLLNYIEDNNISKIISIHFSFFGF